MASIKKNFIYNTAYQLLSILLPIITTPYISRVLGPDGAGQYSYVNAVAYYFIMVIMLGLNNYGNRSIAQVRDNQNKLSKTFCEIYSMQLGCGIVATIVYVLYCTFFTDSILSWIMLASVVASVIDINWFYFGIEKFKLTATRSFLIKIITTASVFTLVKKVDDLSLYVSIMVAGTFVSNAVLWLVIKKEITWQKVSVIEVLRHLKPNLVLFIPIIAVSLYKYMDKIMLGRLSSMTQVGYYEYSEKILQIPLALVNSLAVVMLPKMSNLVAKSDNKQEGTYIEISINFAMFLATSLCLGLMGIAREFVPVFYGKGYDSCVQLFYILLPSCCFVAFANVIRTQYLIPHQEDRVYIISVCLGALVNLVINWILIPRYEAIGAAIGTICAEALVCIYQGMVASKHIPVKKYVQDVIPFLGAGIGMFVVLFLIPEFASHFAAMMVKVFLGVLCYFVIWIFEVKVFFKRNFAYNYLVSAFSKWKSSKKTD